MGIYIVFWITLVTIVLIAAVLAPMGIRFNTEAYEMGEQMIRDSNKTLSRINNATVRASISETLNTALSAQTENIEVNANIFQYGWVAALVLGALVLFLFTRRMVEMTGGVI